MPTRNLEVPPVAEPSAADVPWHLRRPASVQAKLEEAAGLRTKSEQLNAQADSMTTQAKLTGQRIASLQTEKTELLNRIAETEGRDCKAELARNEARFFQIYGKTNKTPAEIVDINSCVQAFGWLPQLEKRLPVLAKMLKSRVTEIDNELSVLAGVESVN